MNQHFHAAVEKIYDAALDPSLWPDALQLVANVFDDVGCILLYGRDDGSFGVIQSPSLNSVVHSYIVDWSTRDIRAIRSRERGYFFHRDVITDRDVVTEPEMDTDPFYAQFLASVGLKYFAAAMVSPTPQIEVAMSVQRARDKAPFSEAEMLELKSLGRHVERSLRLSIRLLNEEISKQGLAAALSRLSIGVFIIDPLGRVLFSNEAAKRLLGDGVDVVAGKLRFRTFSDKDERQPSNALVPENFRDENTPIQISRLKSKRPLTAYLMPAPTTLSPAQQFLINASNIVLLIDPDESSPDPAMVRDLLGLTLAEAKVAALIGSGTAPREAAERLGVAEDTVRKALKSVFHKTGVSRQSELVSLMSRLLLRN